jgi:diacylglycerol kinase family enzyme
MAGVETISQDARLVLVAANPRSGARSSREVVGQLAAALTRERLETRVITDLDELTQAASEAQRAGRLRTVVAAGGDGTLAELVNRTSSDTPLAVFPLGTANLMANFLGIEPQPETFAAMLAAGKSVRIDAARAWSATTEPDGAVVESAPAAGNACLTPRRGDAEERASSPAASGRIFLITAGVGFDAAVVAKLHRQRAGHIRMWNYAKPIWDCVRSYSYPRLRCECAWTAASDAVFSQDATSSDDATSSGPASALSFSAGLAASRPASGGSGPASACGPSPVDTIGACIVKTSERTSAPLETTFDARWLFVQNLPCYAGGLQFAPRANACDGLLDVCGLEYGSFWHGLRYLGYVLSGRHERLADCRMLRVERIRVTSDAPAPVQFDGDPGGQLPLEIESLPLRVRLVGPEGAIARLTGRG